MMIDVFRSHLLTEIVHIKNRHKNYCNRVRCGQYDDCVKCSMDHVIALLGTEDKTLETIKIKYHDKDLVRLEKIAIGDWIDLRASEDVFIVQDEYKLISLGVSMQLPEGYYAEVVPRSSTFKNYGIIMTNSVGVIDGSYCGTNDIWRFPAYCLNGRVVENGVMGTRIHKNERICQFRIVKQMPELQFEEVDELGNDRGGIGSTGKK